MQLEVTDKWFDPNSLLNIYNKINRTEKQLCWTTRGKHDLLDGIGSIFQYQPSEEWDWSEVAPQFKDTLLDVIHKELSVDWKLGRARFMKMDEGNKALSYHYDEGFRLHIPICTTPESWFILEDKQLHSMPELGRLYVLDANKYHSALNLSRQGDPRIHIVISAIKK